MVFIRTLITFFLLWVAVLAAYGIAWWADPPAPHASSQTGGRWTLVLMLVGCALAVWRLWAPARRAPATR